MLVYANRNLSDHCAKLNLVLDRLGKAGLKMDLNQGEFAVKQTKYLGYIISFTEGLKVDSDKVKAIKDWKIPTNSKAVRSFVGFANFYRRFIPNFGRIAAPFLGPTKKNLVFH